MSLTQGTQAALDEVHALICSHADSSLVKRRLDDTILSSQNDMDLLDSCCMRAAVAAMEGSDSLTLSQCLLSVGSMMTERHVLLSYFDGLSALAKGTSTATAQLKFQEVLRSAPSFVLANVGLGIVCFRNKDYRGSFRNFRLALEKLGTDAPNVTRVGMALCAYYLKNTPLATKCVERALQVDPNDVGALMVRLVLLLESRMAVMARVAATVQHLGRLAPKEPVVMQRLADLAFFKAAEQRNVRRYAPALEKLVLVSLEHCSADLGPQRQQHEAYAKYQLGRLALVCGDVSGARALLREAVNALPELVPAVVYLAKALRKLGEAAEAVALLKKIDSSCPADKEVLEMLASHYSSAGMHEMALEYSRRLMESFPSASAHAMAAWCSRLDSRSCVQLLRSSIQMYRSTNTPVPWELRANLASLDTDIPGEELDRLVNECLADAEGPGNRDETNSARASAALFNFALRLEGSARVDQSRQIYARLVKCFPTFEEPYYRLCELSLAAGQSEQALSWIALLQQVSPENETALVYRARILFRNKGAPSLAMECLQIGENSKRRSIAVALARGSIYLWSCQMPQKKSQTHMWRALNKFKYALTKDPSNLLAAHGEACCAAIAGFSNEAALCFDRIAELPPNAPYVTSNIEEHVANVRVACDSFKPALRVLEQLDSNTQTPGQFSAMAFCCAGLHQYEAAIVHVEEGLARFPDHAPLIYNAALVYCAAVMSRLLPHHTTTLDAEAAEKLREWLTKGLEYARSFTESIADMDGREAAKAFVRIVGRHAYSLRDSIRRLQGVATRDRERLQREAEEWRLKQAQLQREKELQRQRKDLALRDKELQLAETYAALNERMLHLFHDAQHQPTLSLVEVPFGDPFAVGGEPEAATRERQDGAEDIPEVHDSAALAIAGMFVDDAA